jgi:hypothetical protein
MVITKTSVEPGSGTDAKVEIHVFGDTADFFAPLANPERDDRKPGQIDSFIIIGPDVGRIQHVGFRIPSPPNGPRWKWQLDWVQVLNQTTGQSSHAPVDRGPDWEVNELDRIFRRDARPGWDARLVGNVEPQHK